jgi:site-specific DNA-cytosine methylase
MEEKLRAKKLGVIEVFAGIGCVAAGFKRSRSFEPILLTDIDQWAKTNFLANNPTGVKYMRRDISDLRPSDLRQQRAVLAFCQTEGLAILETATAPCK